MHTLCNILFLNALPVKRVRPIVKSASENRKRAEQCKPSVTGLLSINLPRHRDYRKRLFFIFVSNGQHLTVSGFHNGTFNRENLLWSIDSWACERLPSFLWVFSLSLPRLVGQIQDLKLTIERYAMVGVTVCQMEPSNRFGARTQFDIINQFYQFQIIFYFSNFRALNNCPNRMSCIWKVRKF